MKVFKFGGASINSPKAIKNIVDVIKSQEFEKLVVVVSAMGKTTNALEDILKFYVQRDIKNLDEKLRELKEYHNEIILELFGDKTDVKLYNLFDELDFQLSKEPSDNFDYDYDQIVSQGELISTKIISQYLNFQAIENRWLDARQLIRTDSNYRDAKVDWETSAEKIEHCVSEYFNFENNRVVVTQGFIGATAELSSTTLGREGSDFSAAIFGHILNAQDVTIWKDVPGLLNADPKLMPDAVLLDEISYGETVELAFFGASIIHPKTIKPLQNKKIPLRVKSFIQYNNRGSIIKDIKSKITVPCFIFKKNQALISISTLDFSFIGEENLSLIFGLFAHFGIKINLMQNSAISFSVCAEFNNIDKFYALVEELKTEFKVRYNLNMELITIRNYDEDIAKHILQNRKIYIEQRDRTTLQMVVNASNKKSVDS
ncbi:MAG: aspartate kinase [Bacteroidales bacterium]